MRFANYAALAAALFLGGCGLETEDTGSDGGTADAGTTSYKFNAGTYVITNTTFSKDECKIESWTGEQKLAIANNIVTWSDEGGTPSGPITNPTFLATNERDVDTEDNCVLHVKKEIRGTLIADDKFTGDYTTKYSVTSGTNCLAASGATVLPAESHWTFLATKKPGT